MSIVRSVYVMNLTRKEILLPGKNGLIIHVPPSGLNIHVPVVHELLETVKVVGVLTMDGVIKPDMDIDVPIYRVTYNKPPIRPDIDDSTIAIVDAATYLAMLSHASDQPESLRGITMPTEIVCAAGALKNGLFQLVLPSLGSTPWVR